MLKRESRVKCKALSSARGFFVRSDLPFRLKRSSRHFRFLYVFWVDFGTKCVNWFRFLYVFWVKFGTKCGVV